MNIIIIVFFLDHITKLVHVNPIRHGMGGGGRGTLCPRQIFLFILGASGILKKPLTKSKTPMVKRVKLEIVNYTFLLVPSSLSCKFNSALPLNYISKRCFRAISFTLANSNIWSVKKLRAIINLSS